MPSWTFLLVLFACESWRGVAIDVAINRLKAFTNSMTGNCGTVQVTLASIHNGWIMVVVLTLIMQVFMGVLTMVALTMVELTVVALISVLTMMVFMMVILTMDVLMVALMVALMMALSLLIVVVMAVLVLRVVVLYPLSSFARFPFPYTSSISGLRDLSIWCFVFHYQGILF